MAKHFECTTSSRGDVPAHSDAMGIALSSMCAAPILRWGQAGHGGLPSSPGSPTELTEIILRPSSSPRGCVSNFVQVDYTTGLAHAIYNGFTILPSTEEHHHLHGEVVSYGILAMLTIDKKYAGAGQGCWPSTGLLGCPPGFRTSTPSPRICPPWRKRPWQGIDVRKWPYEVTVEMIVNGIQELEAATR